MDETDANPTDEYLPTTMLTWDAVRTDAFVARSVPHCWDWDRDRASRESSFETGSNGRS